MIHWLLLLKMRGQEVYLHFLFNTFIVVSERKFHSKEE